MTASKQAEVIDIETDEMEDSKSPPVEGTSAKDKKSKSKGKEDDGKPKLEEPPAVPFRKMFAYADKWDYLLMFLGTIGAICQGATLPVFSFLWGNIMDGLGDNSDVADVITEQCLIMGCLAVGAFIEGVFQIGCWMLASKRQVAKIRQAFFRAIIRQDIGWFDENHPGELAARVAADVNAMAGALGEKVSNAIFNLSTLVLGLAFGFYVSWRLTLVILAVSPILSLLGMFMGVSAKKQATMGRQQYASAGSHALEVLQGFRTITALNAQPKEMVKYDSQLANARRTGMLKGLYAGLGYGGLYGVIFCTYGLAFWYGAKMIRDGHADGGQVVSCFFSVLIGTFSLGQAGPQMEAIATGQGAAAKIFQIIDRVPTIDAIGAPARGSAPPPSKGVIPPKLVGEISLQNVSFTYPARKERQILQGFNLTIPAGSTCALVGPTGSGKSSVIALIQRFYDPPTGSVLVDGVPLQQIDLGWWRDQIGVVTQEPVLFSASIIDNIRAAHPSATDAQIHEACKIAQIHDTIMKLPEGYNTNVGDGGNKLSGGQKQRVAVARAVVKNPRILLLDEATSALDRHSEELVQRALDSASKGRTVVVVAHRLVTIQKADCICVIDPTDSPFSRITEKGNHAKLMSLKGTYYSMAKGQGLGEDTKGGAGGAGHTVSTEFTSVGPTSPASPGLESTRTESAIQDASPKIQTHVDIPAPVVSATKDSKASKPKPEDNAGFSRVAQYAKPYMGLMLLGLAGAAVAGGGYPVLAVLFSRMLKTFYEPDLKKQEDQAAMWAGCFTALGVSSFFAHFFQLFFFNLAGEYITVKVRSNLFKAFMRQDAGFFDWPKNEVGSSAARLSEDADKIHAMFGPQLGLYLRVVVSLACGMGLAFWKSWKLTLVTLSSVPLLVFSSAIQMKFFTEGAETLGSSTDVKEESASPKAKKAQSGEDEIIIDPNDNVQRVTAGQVAAEAISGIRTIQACHMESSIIARYTKVSDVQRKADITNAIVAGIMFGVSQFLVMGSFALAFWYGGAKMVPAGELDFESVVLVCMAVLMSAMGAGEANQFAGPVAEGSGAAARIFPIIDRVPLIDWTENNGKTRLADLDGSIEFRDVHFAYPTRANAKVLNGLNLKIPPSKHVALIGSTGCGKSTVIQLLERFYLPMSGSVLIDGHDITTLDLPWWRSKIGIVQQEPVLFDQTIRENILYGNPSATQEQIETAARLANLHDAVLGMPHKYETVVGPKGNQLSGGQKQRVAIARAVIANPKILILDEATSALDSKSEEEVRVALDRVIQAGNMTVISIAHRLSSVDSADLFAVIEEGKAIEYGTHEQLMVLDGTYRKKYELFHGIQREGPSPTQSRPSPTTSASPTSNEA